MTTTVRQVQETTAPAAGPRAPKFAFPVIDRIVGAKVTRVLGLDAQTPTIVRLQLERPSSCHFRPGKHALLRVNTRLGPDLRPL